MPDQKRIWFSFLPLDYLGVEKYLNDYAAQGWEFTEVPDCRTLTVTMQKTHRTDLGYSVSCASFIQREELRETVEQRHALGWKPLATINHFDIYESMPCHYVLPQEENNYVPLFLRSIRSFFLLLLFSAFLLLLAYSRNSALLNSWYLSNVGIYFHFFSPVFGIISIYYLLWLICNFRSNKGKRPSKRTLCFLRGMFPILAIGWIYVLTAALIVELVPSLSYSVLLIAILTVVALFCYFHFRLDQSGKLSSAISMTLAVVIALSLVLNQVLPHDSRSQLGVCTWRHSISSVVLAEDVGFQPDSLEAAFYEKQGSFFVEETKYWEKWNNLNLSSTVYQCKTSFFARLCLKNLINECDWKLVKSAYKGCWSAEQGTSYLLLCYDKNTIVFLSADQELLPNLAEYSLPFY